MIKVLLIALLAGLAMSSVSYTDIKKHNSQNVNSLFDNLSARNLEKSYYSFLLREKDTKAPKNACDRLAALETESVIENSAVIAFVALKNELSCKNINIKDKFSDYFKKSLKSDKLVDIASLIFAIQKEQVTEKDKVKDQCSKITEFIGSDGYTRSEKRGDVSTLTDTVLLLDSLEVCESLGFSQKNNESVKAGLVALAQGTKNIQPGVSCFMDGNYLANTGELVYHMLRSDKTIFSSETLGQIASYFDKSKKSLDNPRGAYAFFKVADLLAEVPIIRLTKSMIKNANPLKVSASFQSVLDKAIAVDSSAKITAALYDSSRTPIVEDITFSHSSKEWTASIDKDLKPGNYKLKITLTHKGNTFVYREPLTVQGTIKINSVLFDVSNTQGIPEQPPSNEVKFGKKFQGELKANQNNFIHVQFKINSDAPKIRFPSVRLVNRKYQYSTGPVNALQAKDSNTFNAIIDLGDPDHVLPYNGVYDLELAITSDLLEENIVWKFAEIELTFVKNSQIAPAQDGDTVLLPAIEHQFPGERRKANPIITTVFAGALVVALLVFLGSLIGLKANFGHFPSDFFGMIISVVFLFVLLGIIGILVLFWTKYNLFETLSYLSIAFIPTLIIGNMALSRINRPQN